MLSDEERVRLILGEGRGVDDAARAEVELIAATLADAATWADPPGELEALVADQIRAEARLDERAGTPVEQPLAAPALQDRPDRPGRPAHIRRGALALLGAAAAGVVAVGAVLVLVDRDTDEEEAPLALAALTSETDPDASGSARIFDSESGFAIRLELEGLPPLPDDGFYEAWVRDDAGTLVSIGTFSRSAGPITLWSGVDPCRFPTITVTREQPDGDPGSSGDRVLAGPIACDA